jgi:hypothetical protein
LEVDFIAGAEISPLQLPHFFAGMVGSRQDLPLTPAAGV